MTQIPKETPHLFMWFSDGSKIPPGVSPLPENAKLQYIQRLKEECAKLQKTKTPVYLVYMGRLLNDYQKKLLEDLQKEIPNLAVVDFDEVERHISEEAIKNRVSELVSAYKQHEKLSVGVGGIADLVDFTRLILIYHSKTIQEIAQKKIKMPLEWRQGIIYRDFDVTLEKEQMMDIPTLHGYMATLNFSEVIQNHHEQLIDLAKADKEKIKKIDEFFNTYIYDLTQYQRIINLFTNKSLSDDEEKDKAAILEEYHHLCPHPANFAQTFIHTVRIENSFLAVNSDEHPLIRQMIQEVTTIGESPYAVVQKYLRRGFKQFDFLKEYLTPQRIGFKIGNDLTWQMNVKDQHTARDNIFDVSQSSKDKLFETIQAMHDYGEHLKQQRVVKGETAIALALILRKTAEAFFNEDPKQRNFSEFEAKFSMLLHGKDKEMSAYRVSWGTIVANIAIALTGVGLLFIVGKLIQSKLSENRALFFFQKHKTTCEEKIANIEQASRQMQSKS